MKAQLGKSIVSLLVLLLFAVGCSGSSSKNEKKDSSLYTMEEGEGEDDQSLLEGSEEESSEALTTTDPEDEEEELGDKEVAESQEEESEEESVEEVASSESMESTSPEDISVYRVQDDHETLMLIAFKIYGDYRKWKDIAELNKDMFDNRYIVKKGMMIKFTVPDQEFVWKPVGDPYLIKRGDTLSRISHNVYNVYNRWMEIWNNNKPLIKNPNYIFAGFTVYYVPDENSGNEMAESAEVSSDREPTSL